MVDRLPPMAPRVVLHPTDSVAHALPAIPAAATTGQRSWPAPAPTPVNPVPLSQGGSVVQRAPDSQAETTAQSTHPAMSLNGSTVAANGGISTAPTQAGGTGLDVDRLIEAIEERVLAEVERRGGRYRGMF